MSALKNRFEHLAASFASEVLRAIQGTSLENLLDEVRNGARGTTPGAGRPAFSSAPSPPSVPRDTRGGRLQRRSADDIARMLDRIVGLLKQNKRAGLRAEQIKSQLNMQAKELPRPLAEGLKARKLRKTGAKRATVYFAA
jgi:hypothetical protein